MLNIKACRVRATRRAHLAGRPDGADGAKLMEARARSIIVSPFFPRSKVASGRVPVFKVEGVAHVVLKCALDMALEASRLCAAYPGRFLPCAGSNKLWTLSYCSPARARRAEKDSVRGAAASLLDGGSTATGTTRSPGPTLPAMTTQPRVEQVELQAQLHAHNILSHLHSARRFGPP